MDSEEKVPSAKFDDIEMLDISEDSVSSDTASLSSFSNSKDVSTRREFIKLQDWLNSDKVITFDFDRAEYKLSKTLDKWSERYKEYVNSLYKILELLTTENLEVDEEERSDEVIGVVTTDLATERQVKKLIRERKLSDALNKIIEKVTGFIEENEHESDDHLDELQNFYNLLNILDCLYANYFYYDVNLKPELISKWINRFDPKPDEKFVESVMINVPIPFRHPEFWNKYLPQLITRGLLSQATSAVTLSQYDELEESEPALYTVIQDFTLLLDNYTSMAMKDRFADWKLSCCEFRDTFPKFKEIVKKPENQIILSQIYDLSCILTGLPKTTSNYCETWYEIYSALSLFQVRDDNDLFKEYFKIATSEKPPLVIDSDNDDNGDWRGDTETTFIDLIEERFLKVLTTIDRFDKPTAAFVAKLLEYKGVFKTYYSITESSSVRSMTNWRTISEYLLTTFAFDCLNDHSLIPVGIGILLNSKICASSGAAIENRKVVAEFLPHYDCDTNDDLEWALTVCASLNLTSTAHKLYQIQGRKSLKAGYLFEALNMFVNCFNPNSMEPNVIMKDVHFIVWDLIFQDSLLHNRLIKDELINNIVFRKVDPSFEIHPVVRQCLSPYAVLAEYFKSMENGKAKYAMEKLPKLIHLLRHNHLPKKFYPLLLCQTIPFLVDVDITFKLPDLIVIIELFDNFENQISDDESKDAIELYNFCLANEEDEVSSYDWKAFLRKRHIDIPDNLSSLLKFLRNQVVSRIGKVYIDGS